jgi:hypothetical protein
MEGGGGWRGSARLTWLLNEMIRRETIRQPAKKAQGEHRRLNA